MNSGQFPYKRRFKSINVVLQKDTENTIDVLRKMLAKKTLVLRIRKKKQLKFLGRIMKKEDSENLTFTGNRDKFV